MPVVGVVLDTAALLAYANGDERVGEQVAMVADYGRVALIPATCLASAYRDVVNDGWNLLDLLVNHEHTLVSPLEGDDCPVLGGWARTLGLDTAHAAIEAAAHPVVPLMTSQRDLLSQFLPKEWPIIGV